MKGRHLVRTVAGSPQFAFVFGLPLLPEGDLNTQKAQTLSHTKTQFVTECSTAATSTNAGGGTWSLPIEN